MILNLDGHTYKFVWRHEAPECTECLLYQLAAYAPIEGKMRPVWEYTGRQEWADCAPGDQFRKSVGRKVSLEKLLKRLQWSRATRRRIWEAYWQWQGEYGRVATLRNKEEVGSGESCAA